MNQIQHNYCSKCGATLAADSIYCSSCGVAVSGDLTAASEGIKKPDAPEVEAVDGAATDDFGYARGLGWSALVFIAVGLIMLLGQSIGRQLGVADFFGNAVAWAALLAVVAFVGSKISKNDTWQSRLKFIAQGATTWSSISLIVLLVIVFGPARSAQADRNVCETVTNLYLDSQASNPQTWDELDPWIANQVKVVESVLDEANSADLSNAVLLLHSKLVTWQGLLVSGRIDDAGAHSQKIVQPAYNAVGEICFVVAPIED